MADISTYIEKLQNAVYGEEVRGAIIDALNAINNDKGGMTNKTIAFPSGGNVIPENGVSLYVGQATSDVTINRAADGSTSITANVIFRKGSATQIIFAPDYLRSHGNTFNLSSYSSSDYIVVNIVNGAPSIGKSSI